MAANPAPVALPGFEGVSAPGTVYRAADYYGTPADATREIVRHLVHRAPPRPGLGWVLEAGVGGGAFAAALADAGYHVRGLDVRPEAVAECNRLGLERLREGRRGTIEAKLGDFETWAGPSSCGWGAECIAAVGNPPFWGDGPRLLAWMRRLFTFAPLVMQVLPTRFMHTMEKAAFHREHRADLVFFDDRLPFDGVGGKDECIGWMSPTLDGLGRNYRVGDVL